MGPWVVGKCWEAYHGSHGPNASEGGALGWSWRNKRGLKPASGGVWICLDP